MINGLNCYILSILGRSPEATGLNKSHQNKSEGKIVVFDVDEIGINIFLASVTEV